MHLILLAVMISGCATKNTEVALPTQTTTVEPKIIYFDQSKQIPGKGGWVPYSVADYGYPIQAATRQISGCAKVEYTIEVDGSVSNPVLLNSFPAKIFDRSTIRQVLSKKFVLADKAMKPESVRITETIKYALGIPADSEVLQKCNS